jgi:hypothetical protein
MFILGSSSGLREAFPILRRLLRWPYVNLINKNFLIKICLLSYFTIVISWDFSPKKQIACMAKSSLWTWFLEASVEEMLPTAYVDARTTKWYFCEFFLAVIFYANWETSEKIPRERLFLCKTVVLQETYLVLGCWLACCFCFDITS